LAGVFIDIAASRRFNSHPSHFQDNHPIYPTLGQIALDILPCQASSVPCEWLFSASKQVATDRHARLGGQRFEELQLMKFAWCHNIVDVAVWNSSEVEQVDLEEYKDFFIADGEQTNHNFNADSFRPF
jgi:hypothetical protein